MILLAIDPGPTECGWVLCRVVERGLPEVMHCGVSPTEEMIQWSPRAPYDARAADAVVIEKVESFGMAVGAEVFETVYVSGRLAQAVIERVPGTQVARIGRRAVKLHLCGNARAKDTNIRQAILDRYGGRVTARGDKKIPGPLYKVKSHAWPALALAITRAEKIK
jgi:hypothetical protein